MERPPNVYFADLLREWSLAVARMLVWRSVRDGNSGDSELSIQECWVGEDLAVYARYLWFSRRMAARCGQIDADPATSTRFDAFNRNTHASSSGQQASNLYDIQLAEGPYCGAEWTDSLGYEWWGDTPEEGWKKTVEQLPRLNTVLPMSTGHG